MTAETAPAAGGIEVSLVVTIARKELRDAIRGRWFWLYSIGFGLPAALLAWVALPGSVVAGSASFGRTAASLVALVQLIVPLMGLSLGAQAIAGQAERGTLRFLLSHPLTRSEAFLGTYVGLALALLATCAAGFGAAGLVTVLRGSGAHGTAFLRIAALSWVLAVVMLGIGMLISAVVRRSGTALGAAVFAWLALVFLGELGIMGTAIATRLPVDVLFLSAVLNPIEAFRLAALTALSGSLDVLGPAGKYAVDTYGGALSPLLVGVLVLWVIVPSGLAWWRFARSRDV